MRKNEKKALYESIMMDIAKLVKRAINKNVNESYWEGDYIDDYGNMVIGDEHLAHFGVPHFEDIPKIGKTARARIAIDITVIVRENRNNYDDIIQDLYDDIKEEFYNVDMELPVVDVKQIDYVVFRCDKHDARDIKSMIAQKGFKIRTERELEKYGININK